MSVNVLQISEANQGGELGAQVAPMPFIDLVSNMAGLPSRGRSVATWRILPNGDQVTAMAIQSGDEHPVVSVTHNSADVEGGQLYIAVAPDSAPVVSFQRYGQEGRAFADPQLAELVVACYGLYLCRAQRR